MSLFCNPSANTEANTSVLVSELSHISCLAFYVLSSPPFPPQNFPTSSRQTLAFNCEKCQLQKYKVNNCWKSFIQISPLTGLSLSSSQGPWKGFFILIFQPGYQMDFYLSVCMLFKSWLLPSVCLGVEQNDDPSKHQCHSVTVSATSPAALQYFGWECSALHLHALSSASLWCPSPGSHLLVSVSKIWC